MTEDTLELWTHHLCCVDSINTDPSQPERFDRVKYFTQLECMAIFGCQIVVSPAMAKCVGDRPEIGENPYPGRPLYLYLNGVATHPERVHYVRRPA
jgi:hypothetical protein